jgi:hypothetical protein
MIMGFGMKTEIPCVGWYITIFQNLFTSEVLDLEESVFDDVKHLVIEDMNRGLLVKVQRW